MAEYPSLRVTYLYLNNSKAPLNQADLRRAISWSTDYQGMVNGILSGNGKQMRGPIPEGMPPVPVTPGWRTVARLLLHQ